MKKANFEETKISLDELVALRAVAEAAKEFRNYWFSHLDLKSLPPEAEKLREAVENWQRVKDS